MMYVEVGEERQILKNQPDVTFLNLEMRYIGIIKGNVAPIGGCLLYTSDAADDLLCVDLGGRRIIKKKKNQKKKKHL